MIKTINHTTISQPSEQTLVLTVWSSFNPIIKSLLANAILSVLSEWELSGNSSPNSVVPIGERWASSVVFPFRLATVVLKKANDSGAGFCSSMGMTRRPVSERRSDWRCSKTRISRDSRRHSRWSCQGLCRCEKEMFSFRGRTHKTVQKKTVELQAVALRWPRPTTHSVKTEIQPSASLSPRSEEHRLNGRPATIVRKSFRKRRFPIHLSTQQTGRW